MVETGMTGEGIARLAVDQKSSLAKVRKCRMQGAKDGSKRELFYFDSRRMVVGK